MCIKTGRRVLSVFGVIDRVAQGHLHTRPQHEAVGEDHGIELFLEAAMKGMPAGKSGPPEAVAHAAGYRHRALLFRELEFDR